MRHEDYTLNCHNWSFEIVRSMRSSWVATVCWRTATLEVGGKRKLFFSCLQPLTSNIELLKQRITDYGHRTLKKRSL